MTSSVTARTWFAVTALVVLIGLVIQVPVAMDYEQSFFSGRLDRALNVLAFFTIQSNIIVGVTSLVLALGRVPTSTLFRVFRLTGVIAISLTFIVFHLALGELQDLTGQAAVADFLLHTASPIVCVVGWLVFGPRGQTPPPVVALTLVFPVAWGVFTLIRGEIIDWYPYPFMDPFELGYVRVAINLALIAATFVVLASAAHWLDGHLGRRGRTQPASVGV
ncbi:MAG: Pr6Pr family membrane protein [Acidimicrobiales bacterium]